MGVAKLQEQISQFFAEDLKLEVPSVELDMVQNGLLDSLTFVNVLLYLEQEFGIEVSLDDLEVNNFCSIEKIARFIMQRNVMGIGSGSEAEGSQSEDI